MSWTTRIASAGPAIFAVTMIGLGVQGLFTGGFAVIWQPVSTAVPGREALAYVCAGICLVCGAGLLWKRTAGAAARLLLVYLLLWLLVFRVPGLFRSLGVDVYWAACRTAVIAAAAWVLSGKGVRVARALYGLAIIPFGLAHFEYVKQTAAQVPGWLPAHVAWVYFTGGAFVAAGIAILVGVYARLAAALSALEMGLFLVLVWVPVLAAGATNAFQRGEAIVSWALAVAGWVVANSFRGRAPAETTSA